MLISFPFFFFLFPALHMHAYSTFTDVYGNQHTMGDEYLITPSMSRSRIFSSLPLPPPPFFCSSLSLSPPLLFPHSISLFPIFLTYYYTLWMYTNTCQSGLTWSLYKKTNTASSRIPWTPKRERISSEKGNL